MEDMKQLKERLKKTVTEKNKLGRRYRFLDVVNKNLEGIIKRRNKEIKKLKLGGEESREARKQKDLRGIRKITHYFPPTKSLSWEYV